MKKESALILFLKRRGKDLLLLLFFVIAVIAVCVAINVVQNGKKAGGESGGAGETETEAVEKLKDNIHLPGYGSLSLKADTAEQELSLKNPAENTVLLRISLLLEDGTVLWTGELLEPGEASGAITLTKSLEAGEYDAILRYECFDAEEPTKQLNGANAKLLLKVQ